jgi:hypothetical protein
MNEDELRRLLLSMLDRIDTLLPMVGRLDAVEGQLKSVSVDARASREGTDQLGRLVSLQSDQLRTLSDAVAIVAGTQADTSKALGDLAQQVATMNERLGRMVEGSVRGRTNDAQRYADLEARVAELERRTAPR